MKIYKAKTIMGFYVTLKSGGHKYLNFEPTNDGRSMLTVKDKEVMEAIENTEAFKKKIITLWMNTEPDEAAEETKAVESEKTAEPASNAGNKNGMKEEKEETAETPESDEAKVEPVAEEKAAEEEPEAKVETFACYEDAREYVHDTFGTPKKKLMSKAAVIGAAADNGVTIVIED